MSIQYYQDNAESFFSSTVNVNMDNVYGPFVNHLIPGSRILDAGCGSGRDTKFFLEKGYKVDAFDASSKLAERASAYTGIEVKVATFNDVDAVERYDGIWCCASLLHVPKEMLPSVMAKLSTALKPQGIWYVSFKYGNAERLVQGRTFTDMDEQALSVLVGQIRTVEVSKMWTSTDNRPGREEIWLNALLVKHHL